MIFTTSSAFCIAVTPISQVFVPVDVIRSVQLLLEPFPEDVDADPHLLPDSFHVMEPEGGEEQH